MSQIPAQPDGRLAIPDAGREYTFGQLLRIALRQFWRNKWLALLWAFLIFLISLALSVGVEFLWLPVAFWTLDHQLGPTSMRLVSVAQYSFLAFAYIFLTRPLVEPYKWAAVASHTTGRLRWRELTRPWRSPWRGPFFACTFWCASLAAVILTGSWLAYTSTMRFAVRFGIKHHDPVGIALKVILDLGEGVALLVLILVPLIILAGFQRKVWPAFKDQLRILRAQPARFLGLVGIWMVAWILVSSLRRTLFAVTLSHWAPADVELGLCQLTIFISARLIHGLVLAPYMFLIASFFRAAYGLPLEPAAVSDSVVEESSDVR